jgi:hypothetical protein
MVEMAHDRTQPFNAAICHHVRMVDRLESGDLPGSEEDLQVVERLADQAGQHGLRVQLAWNRTVRALHEGHFEEAERRIGIAHALESRGDATSADFLRDTTLVHLHIERGRLEAAQELIRAHAEDDTGDPLWRVLGLRVLTESGELTAARAAMDTLATDAFTWIPRILTGPTVVAHLAEACSTLDDEQRAAQLLDVVTPWSSRILVTASGHQAHGALDYYRALLTATGGDLDRAIDLHRSGLASNRRVDARPYVARSCLVLGGCLLRRDASGDQAEAVALLSEGLRAAEEVGMAVVARAIRTLIQRLVPA